MRKTKTIALLPLMLCFLFAGCQNQSTTPTPTTDEFTKVIVVEGTAIQFIREASAGKPTRVYREALRRGVLTLQDNCIRVGEDGPVVVWPHDFTPHINDGVLEVHDADGQVVARVGDHISLAGGGTSRIAADGCPGPVWIDTRIAETAVAPGSSAPTPTTDEFTKVIVVEGTAIQFIREASAGKPTRVYREALRRGVLTLQDNCIRVGEDGPVVVWPHDFTPHINDGVLEVHDADGQVVARVGDHISLAGGGTSRIAADGCPGPVWIDTRIMDRQASSNHRHSSAKWHHNQGQHQRPQLAAKGL